MSVDERKVQLAVGVDASQARSGFEAVKQGAQDLATSVAASGQQAAKGVDAIGATADGTAKKVERAQANMVASIQRATAVFQAGERGSAKYFETLAAQRGVSVDVLRPYLADLEAARRLQEAHNQSLRGTGISAAQTAAALRGVPAQFTDIFTSLQGGQAPMTVLLQQGGQLKDMFGGVGAAAKAMGGYVLGLVNPFTLTAAVVGTAALAYKQGREESEALDRALMKNGARIGLTVSDLNEMAKALAASSTGQVTRGAAADTLAQIAASGAVASDKLREFAQTAMDMSRYVGVPVADTAKAFSDLARDPVAATLKLNDAMNYLTASQFAQIQSLDQLGKKTEAAKLAQQAYADAAGPAVAAYRSHMGSLEVAMTFWTNQAKSMWDAMLGIGRSDTFDERINKIKGRLTTLQGNDPFGRLSARDLGFSDSISALMRPEETQARLVKQTRDQLNLMLRLNEVGVSNARIEGERNRAKQASLVWQQEGLKYLTKEQQLLIEIERIRNQGKASGASEAEINQRVAQARANAPKPSSAGINKAAKELADYYNLVTDLAGAQSGLNSDFNRQAQILYLGWQRSGDSIEVYDRAMSQLLDRQPFAIKQAKDLADMERGWFDLRAKRYKEIESQAEADIRSAQQSAQGVAERVLALQDEEDAIARAAMQNTSLAASLEEVRVARLLVARSSALAAGEQERVDAINAEIAARRELATLTDRKAGRDESMSSMRDILNASIGTNFAAGFDQATQSLGNFVDQFTKMAMWQERYQKARKAEGATSAQIAQLEAQNSRMQLNNYAVLTGAAKGFFGQKTAAYKALTIAEQGLRAMELASAVASISQTMAVGQAKAVTGVTNQSGGDPYSAFPRMAAMAAIMTGLGFAVGGFGGGSGGDFAPTNTGTGTVLGDSSAMSESITRSIDSLKDIETATMRYSAGMLISLQMIESSVGGLAALMVQSGGIGAGALGVNTGFKASGFGNVLGVAARALAANFSFGITEALGLGGVIDKFVSNLFGTSTKIRGQGITAGGQSLGSIAANGFDASYFTDVEQKKKFLGITTSTSGYTIFSEADAQLERQITNIFGGFTDAIEVASGPLGVSFDLVEKKLDSFVVGIGRIDLAGLSGTQISERLTAVFSAAGDQIASAALGGFEAFQKVGEGYLQTVVRVASGVELARSELRRLGVTAVDLAAVSNKQGDVSAELVRQSVLATEGLSSMGDILRSMSGTSAELAATYRSLTDVRTSLRLLGLDGAAVSYSLLDGAGGLQQLSDAVAAFESGFLSSSQQLDVKAGRMAKQFSLLGLAMPSSSGAFVDLVHGIDTSTSAGQQLLGSVLGLSGGFADLLGAIKDVGSGIQAEINRINGLSATSGTSSLFELQTQFAIQSAAARAGDQSAINLLPQISQAMLKAADASATSALDMAAIQARTVASLQGTLAVISDPNKRLGSIGSGYVAGSTTDGGVGQLVSEMQALKASLSSALSGLTADQKVQTTAVVMAVDRVSSILSDVTRGGNALVTVSA